MLTVTISSEREIAGSVSRFDLPVTVPGFHYKPGENGTGTASVTSVPGLYGHRQDGTLLTTGQNQQNMSGNSKIYGGRACLSLLTFMTY